MQRLLPEYPVFAEIIPLEASLDHRWLTYFVPENLRSDLRVGSFVEIPLRSELIHGVVGELSAAAPIDAEEKSIVRILGNIPILSPYQVDVVYEAAKYYFVHAHKALSLFLTAGFVRQFCEKDIGAIDFEILASWDEKKMELSLSTNTSGYAEIFQDLENGAYIFPSIQAANDFYVFAKTRIPEEHILFRPESLPEVADFEFQKAILLGYTEEKLRAASIRKGQIPKRSEIRIIIWTRPLCFYNLSRFRRIFYFEAALSSTRSHSFHVYENLFFLKMFAKHGFKITVISRFPPVDLVFDSARGEYISLVSHENSR